LALRSDLLAHRLSRYWQRRKRLLDRRQFCITTLMASSGSAGVLLPLEVNRLILACG
jgi:hypothetical protein